MQGNKTKGNITTDVMMRSAGDVKICDNCCNADICNSAGCGATGIAKTSTYFHLRHIQTWLGYRVKICDKPRCQRSARKRARLMTSHVNIYFCRRPLQNSPFENVAIMSNFLSVSC